MTDASLVPLDQAPFTWKTLTAIAGTEFVPKGLRGRPEAMLAAVLTGRELGIGPMASLRGIDMIDGSPSLSGELQVALIRSAGHRIRPVKVSHDAVTVRGERVADGHVVETLEHTFTVEMAKQAGLLNKGNWKSYPEIMLTWRAVTFVARVLFADIVGGVKVTYSPDELGSDDWVPMGDAMGTEIDAVRRHTEQAEPPADYDVEAVEPDVQADAWTELLTIIEGTDPAMVEGDALTALAHRLNHLCEVVELPCRWSDTVDVYTEATGNRPAGAGWKVVLGAFLDDIRAQVFTRDGA